MKPRTILLLAVAVMLGLGAAYMAAKMLGSKPPEEPVKVLVAAADVDQGTYLGDPTKYFREMDYVKGTEPKNAILRFEDMKGRILNKSMPEGQFCTEGDLLPKEKQIVIRTTDRKPFNDKNRMMAVALRVTASDVAGGWIPPGAHVDALYFEQIANTNKHQVRTILYDVEVLALDNMSELPQGQSTHNPSTITLALTPEQCERLVLASEKGKVRFTLLERPSWDNAKETARRKSEPPVGDAAPSVGAEEPEGIVEVWVAKADIKAGTKVDLGLFEKKKFLQTQSPARAITDLGRHSKEVLKYPLAANQFVTDADLESPIAEAKATPLPEGHVLEVHNGPRDLRIRYPKDSVVGIEVDRMGQPIRADAQQPQPIQAGPGGQEWKKFTSAEGQFQVMVPSDVRPQKTSDLDPKSGTSVPKFVFFASRPDVGDCVVSFEDLPQSSVQDSAVKVLNDRAAYLVQNQPTAKLLGQKPVATGSFDGVELRFDLGGGVYECRRLYLVKQRLYEVTMSGKQSDPSAPEAEKFFKSFTILEPD